MSAGDRQRAFFAFRIGVGTEIMVNFIIWLWCRQLSIWTTAGKKTKRKLTIHDNRLHSTKIYSEEFFKCFITKPWLPLPHYPPSPSHLSFSCLLINENLCQVMEAQENLYLVFLTVIIFPMIILQKKIHELLFIIYIWIKPF